MKYFNIQTIKCLGLYLFVFLGITACGNDQVESQRTESSIIVNGISDDWQNYNQFVNEDWKVLYSIINDDSSLSLMFQFRDPRLARKIDMRGLTLWINTDGDEEKLLGIRYENRRLMDKILNDLAEGKMMPPDIQQKADRDRDLDLSGTFSIVDEEVNIISELDESGFDAALQENQGNYCFEYNIPQNSGNGFSFAEDTDLRLGIEIAAVSEEFKEMMKEKMEAEMKKGKRPNGEMRGGMRPGGKRNGRMGGPPAGGRENLLKNMDAQEIWFLVKLAKLQPSNF